MIFSGWLVAVLLGLSHAMKRTAESTSEEPKTKRQEIIHSAVEEEDCFSALPDEILESHILTSLPVASILLMGMTSKKNNTLCKKAFALCIQDNHEILAEELFAEKLVGANSPQLCMLKYVVSKYWPTSTDCVERFRLRTLKHAILSKVNGLPYCSPHPIFFPSESKILYVQIAGRNDLGRSAIVHRAFDRYVFNADLLSVMPASLINDLKTDGCLIVNGEGHRCETLVHRQDLLEEVLKFDLVDYFVHGENVVEFREIIDGGLDCMLNYDPDDVSDDDDYELDHDLYTIALVAHLADSTSIKVVKFFVDAIDEGDINRYAHLLCRSRLDANVILGLLNGKLYLDNLLIYTLLLENGHTIQADWFTAFHNADRINQVLDSYSDDLEDFTILHHDENDIIDHFLFLAVCRKETLEVIMALIRRAQFVNRASAMFFLLQTGHSEDLIRFFLSQQENDCSISNVPDRDIPNSLVPDIIPHFSDPLPLSDLFPTPEKYAAALKYLAENDCWTAGFSILKLVRWEVRFSRPLVLQAVLDLATKNDFASFAVQQIFRSGMDPVEMAKERLPVMEYLQQVPIAKLVEAIVNAGPQNPDILNPSLPGVLNGSMLPLIYRIVLASPRAFARLLAPEYGPIHQAMIYEAWMNIFIGCGRPDNPIQNFFMLLHQMFLGNSKAAGIICPVASYALCSFGGVVEFPEHFTFKHIEIASYYLKVASAVISSQKLVANLAALKGHTTSPFTEAVFKRLICRPRGLVHIIEARIVDCHELLHLLHTYLPPIYLTDNLATAILNGVVSVATCPWLETGLTFY